MRKPTISEKDPLIQAVANTLTRYRMIRPGDRVLVGFSGGGDSTALLLCLHHLTSKRSVHVGAAHLNHGLRGKRSEAEARQAADLARRLGIPFFSEARQLDTHRTTNRLSLEEAAREMRYQFLQDVAIAEGFGRIALGHHQDDDAELMLMRFLRGSGSLGLSGMPPRRPSSNGALVIIRPFIRTPRSAIRAFLSRLGVVPVEDESNTDESFLRNRIRHRLLPLLKAEYNPSLVAGLSRMAELMRDEEDWLQDGVDDRLMALTLSREKALLILDRQGLADSHPALQRRILRAAVKQCKGNLRRIGFAQLEGARELAVQGPAHGSCDLPDGLQIRGRGDRLEIRHLDSASAGGRAGGATAPVLDFTYRIAGPGRYVIHEAGVTLDFSILEAPPEEGAAPTGQQTAFFDMDQLCFPLIIRNFYPGDRMTPLGLNGTQKVKKIFIDRKIDREKRPHYPLLVNGDEIIWIAGLRQSEVGKVTSATTRWLKVETTGCLSIHDD